MAHASLLQDERGTDEEQLNRTFTPRDRTVFQRAEEVFKVLESLMSSAQSLLEEVIVDKTSSKRKVDEAGKCFSQFIS